MSLGLSSTVNPSLQMPGKVCFVNYRDRKARSFQAHDLFYLPSVRALRPVLTGEFTDYENVHGLDNSAPADPASADYLFFAPFPRAAQECSCENKLLPWKCNRRRWLVKWQLSRGRKRMMRLHVRLKAPCEFVKFPLLLFIETSIQHLGSVTHRVF